MAQPDWSSAPSYAKLVLARTAFQLATGMAKFATKARYLKCWKVVQKELNVSVPNFTDI